MSPQPKDSGSLMSRLDTFLQLYCKWASSSLLTEQGIKLVQYVAWILSQISQQNQRFHKEFSPSLQNIFSDLNTVRYILRFYGLPQAMEGFRSGSWSGGKWNDKKIHKLASIMALSMLFYHPLEHVAYAKYKMPKLMPNSINSAKLFAWSSRFWLIYIIADWASSVLKIRELRQKKTLLLETGPETESNIEEIRELEKKSMINKMQIARCALFTLPCMSWCHEKPWLSDKIANVLCFVESVTNFYQSIHSFSK
mmetsp:Transcript_7085/g.10158  ORF Transcript_7085/g.10158 Transcript_7085/m.10158 type:complete len:253 (+) Transcript_7085:238-996(+)